MKVRRALAGFRHGWWVACLLCVVGAGFGWLAAAVTPQSWTAVASVVVEGAPVKDADTGSTAPQAAASASAAAVGSSGFLEAAAQRAGLPIDTDGVTPALAASVTFGDPTVRLEATTGDRQDSRALVRSAVEELSESLTSYRVDTDGADGAAPVLVPIVVRQTGPVTEPAGLVSPQPLQNIAAGGVAGLLLGVALVLARRAIAVVAVRDGTALHRAGSPRVGRPHPAGLRRSAVDPAGPAAHGVPDAADERRGPAVPSLPR